MSAPCRKLFSNPRISVPSSSRVSQFVRSFHSSPSSMSTLAAFRLPNISNEPNHHYEKGGKSREGLEAAVKALKEKAPLDIPIVVSEQAISPSSVLAQNNPSSHGTPIAKYSNASAADVNKAIDAALAAK